MESNTVYVVLGFIMLCAILFLTLTTFGQASYLGKKQVSPEASTGTGVPQYFQTTPEIYAGPTATGAAPFLAATNQAPFGATRSFVANTPLETALPIVGDTRNTGIFHLMGQLSPYFPNPEYDRPSFNPRHALTEAVDLEFRKCLCPQMRALIKIEILVPVGRQE
ncbi:MAG: hypothetical protein Q9196_005019 [Gyalolechia fulgens]